MEMCVEYLKVFFAGGMLCLIGQILIEKTALTPARILSSYVVAGVALSAAGVYEPFVEWAGAGASIPLTGFGHVLAEGIREAVAERGFLGILSGGLTASSVGIAAAIVLGLIFALISRPSEK
jgi:stage V sporulation protein AE